MRLQLSSKLLHCMTCVINMRVTWSSRQRAPPAAQPPKHHYWLQTASSCSCCLLQSSLGTAGSRRTNSTVPLSQHQEAQRSPMAESRAANTANFVQRPGLYFAFTSHSPGTFYHCGKIEKREAEVGIAW